MAGSLTGQTFVTSDVVDGQKFYTANYLALIAQMQALNDELLAECLTLAGAQTITGNKTFSGITIVPDQTASDNSTKAANTKYVDGQDAADHPTYSGGESHTDGSGLITKTGNTGSGAVDQSVTFGTAFPNGITGLSVLVRRDSGTAEAIAHTISASGFSIRINVAVQDCWWIAKGY